MLPAPLMVLDADAFAVTPATRPPNDAVTENAFAFVAGLLVNETRTTNVIPAIYVPVPVMYVGAPVIVNAARALIAITIVFNPVALNARDEISSVPVTVVVIVTVGWLTAPTAIVTLKSM